MFESLQFRVISYNDWNVIPQEFNHLFGFVERLSTSDRSFVTVENLVRGATKHKTKIPNQQVITEVAEYSN